MYPNPGNHTVAYFSLEEATYGNNVIITTLSGEHLFPFRFMSVETDLADFSCNATIEILRKQDKGVTADTSTYECRRLSKGSRLS